MPSKPLPTRDEALLQIRTLASTGFSVRGIASHFGVSYETWHKWIEGDAELDQAFKEGREQERYALHNALYRKAMNGDGPAAMFLLKSRHGYREGDQSDTANRVAIQFVLPAAMKPEDYKAKVIDGNASNSAQQLPDATS